MKNDWILDVLADLKVFAESNDLINLANKLEETARVACSEIEPQRDDTPRDVGQYGGSSRTVCRQIDGSEFIRRA